MWRSKRLEMAVYVVVDEGWKGVDGRVIVLGFADRQSDGSHGHPCVVLRDDCEGRVEEKGRGERKYGGKLN